MSSVTPEPAGPARIAPWTSSVTMDDLSDAVRDPRRLAAVRGTRLLDAPAAPTVGRIVALAARPRRGRAC